MSNHQQLNSLPVVTRCHERIVPRARYVLDTLFLAMGQLIHFSNSPPSDGPWIYYGTPDVNVPGLDRCLPLLHSPESWSIFDTMQDIARSYYIDGLPVAIPSTASAPSATGALSFDLVANAFYFLSSWPERTRYDQRDSRALFETSAFGRLGVTQDVVDQYLARLEQGLAALEARLGRAPSRFSKWPEGKDYALVLSHDVDFLPGGFGGNLRQGLRTFLRHLVRQGRPLDALRSARGLVSALVNGRDPYGCVPAIIAEEKQRGVQSSFQVAVANRHPMDVAYRIDDDATRDYLHCILDNHFDLCLHGSYRSTENPSWYVEEVAILTERMRAPIGSRQHYLSFAYDSLFSAQEASGIHFDMSMGFPDRPGPRAGFSYPYFPYNLADDRPYNVVEISLFLMDVTFQGYMNLRAADAQVAIEQCLADLKRKRGCASVVWHPIVFGGARDPGYDRLYWDIVDRVIQGNGLATDGSTVNGIWRRHARQFTTFALL